MITRATNSRSFAKNQLAQLAQAAEAARATAAPAFADVRRFAEPSSTRMVWMASASGHPSFV